MAFEQRDFVTQMKFALLEALNLDHIGHGPLRKSLNRIVQITMLRAQMGEAFLNLILLIHRCVTLSLGLQTIEATPRRRPDHNTTQPY